MVDIEKSKIQTISSPYDHFASNKIRETKSASSLQWPSLCPQSHESRPFVQPFVQANIKQIQSCALLAPCEMNHRLLWILLRSAIYAENGYMAKRHNVCRSGN